jgi:hypothetical protein
MEENKPLQAIPNIFKPEKDLTSEHLLPTKPARLIATIREIITPSATATVPKIPIPCPRSITGVRVAIDNRLKKRKKLRINHHLNPFC